MKKLLLVFAVFVVALTLLVSTTKPALASDSGTWSATGSLNTARANHTATLLNNGEVLVAGGWGANGILASTELYTGGKWVNTGSMSTARAQHTATLLNNGQVLVAGGLINFLGSIGTTATAELYDPTTGQWTPTGSLITARSNQTATLLPNGQVLVAGGLDGNNASLASAELYDPATSTWHATGSMSIGHGKAAAVLLQNGQVLIAGGSTDTSAEIYNPATGTWTKTGNMNLTHSPATIALLPNGNVLLYGGQSTLSNASEFYNTATGSWIKTGAFASAKTCPNYGNTLTLLNDGQVLFAGGHEVKYAFVTLARSYDVSTNSWLYTGSLNTTRGIHTATLLPNGQVLVAGGQTNAPLGTPNILASAELYTP